MDEVTTVPAEGRNARRKELTRAALVRAARVLLLNGGAQDASIKTITDLADVGFGSFFNHFESKTDLFDTALNDAARLYGEWLDEQLDGVTDPVRRLVMSIRLTGRLHQSHPEEAQLLIGQFTFLDAGSPPLANRVRTDVVEALAVLSQVSAHSESTALAATGAIAAVLRAAAKLPADERVQLADSLVVDVLRLLGSSDQSISELMSESVE